MESCVTSVLVVMMVCEYVFVGGGGGEGVGRLRMGDGGSEERKEGRAQE